MGESAVVCSWELKTSTEGEQYREVIGAWTYANYEDAESYILSQESGNYVLGNLDPLVTPVPLEKLEHYKLVHQSSDTVTIAIETAGKNVPAVKIFQYMPD